ncbi:MAG: glycine reductase, partial [Pyramidobacter sp.]|nr:glycine reductase [Pyramidobacter sp.]
IISRASGAPVIASALSLNASAAKNGLPAIVAKELAAAKAAGLDELIEAMQPKQAAAEEDVKAPAAEPTDEEIHGVDVLAIEDAVRELWKHGIYAESSMGCTGPVVKLNKSKEEEARKILAAASYI